MVARKISHKTDIFLVPYVKKYKKMSREIDFLASKFVFFTHGIKHFGFG
jgi:hypothetical protein